MNTLNHVVIRWKDVARHDGQMDTFPAKGFAGHLIEACARIEESTVLGGNGDVADYLTNHCRAGSKVMLEQRESGAEQCSGSRRKSTRTFCL